MLNICVRFSKAKIAGLFKNIVIVHQKPGGPGLVVRVL
jgi:hypothetical protein